MHQCDKYVVIIMNYILSLYIKKGLCPFDDKRFVLNDGINTRAHGHFLNFLSL